MTSRLFTTAAFALLQTLRSLAADAAPPSVTVSGTALTHIAPDLLQWQLEVKSTGPDLAKVAEKHSERVSAVLELLKKQSIAEKDMQTSQMQFGRNRVLRRNEWTEEGFFASTEVSFKLTDLNKYKTLWLALAEQSGVSITTVAFDHSKRIELRKETRRKALLAAKEKAADMAETLGVQMGEPISISEDFVGDYRMSSGNNAANSQSISTVAGDGESSGAIAPGTIPISVRVVVSFWLTSPVK